MEIRDTTTGQEAYGDELAVPSTTDYLTLISSLVKKSCLVDESFPICAQTGLTWNVKAYVEA